MTKNINELKFNFTSQMASLLIKYNKLKKEYDDSKDAVVLEELLSIKKEFIKLFRDNNKNEIEEYMEIKDQIWSFFVLKKFFVILRRIIYIENKF